MGEAGSVRVGVAGWSYKDWQGIVYPRNSSRFDALVYMSHYVDCIEINSSFYRIPSPDTTRSWAHRARSVNPNFRLTVKLFSGFTHERNATDEQAWEFHQAMTPLAEAGLLAAVLIQFPFSFKPVDASLDYLDSLVSQFDAYPLVVEVRHQSWNEPEFFTYLRKRGVGFCNIDQPVIGQSLAPSQELTGPVGYVRLHGRNHRDWFREDAGRDARYDYLYPAEELDPWMERISEISDLASETFVITNNHFRGQAVVNALQIKHRLVNRKLKAPAELVASYPVLEAITEPDGAFSPSQAQGRLF